MKIKDIVQESVYDWFTQRDAARTQASSQQKDRLDTQQAQAQQQAARQMKINPARSTSEPTQPAGPEIDISKIVPADTQYKFRNPEVPGGFIIIRQTGYYVDSLPAALKSQVKRDKATGLYPVLRAENIKKYNQYYNAAADANGVREEPVHAL